MGYSNGLCVICGNAIENTEHLLVDCGKVNNLWKYIEQKLINYDPICGSFTRFNKIAGILKEDQKFDEINMILGIVRWEIWKSRCRIQYDNDMDKHNSLLKNVIFNIRNHVKVLLQTKRLWCSDNLKRLQYIFQKID